MTKSNHPNAVYKMRTEDLALRHLGVDITRTEFWQSAVDSALAELDEFLALTAKA
ncbi:MAG: hypothetical protein DDT39_01466 [Firmicutes bacterium]|nr:hypothetical protein [candidate division NPL-UPA2 bacterium]